MPNFRDLLNSLPADTQDMLRLVWETLPPSERQNLQNVFTAFPSEANLMRLLINLSMVEFRMAFGRKNSVVIVGPANVGKSTLYNQLIYSKSERAEVSPLPGTTRINQLGDVGLFSLVDTPGADAIGEVGEHEKELAFQAASQADFLIVMFDAIQGVKKTELELYKELQSLDKPFIIVLNKMDLVRRDIQKVTEQIAVNLGVPTEQIVKISARDGKNIEHVLLAIAAAEPEIVAALGKALPAYRWQLAWRAIVSAASVSAVIALTPLPFVDFAPLIITQSVMMLGIARIYNYEITPKRARELAVTFGLGFLGRTLFQELSKLGGIPGWLLSAAIASSTTVAMGYAASVWFERGER
ncbi:MAG: 50S ribosome-binding GTPase, partial [Anaerolineaceae bacterium]|nr:50S ribosome-binding GTPase [Anaerolineaceae bacterium]